MDLMALRPSSCRVCMSFSTKDLRGSNSCSSGSHGGPFTTTLTPWKYLSRPSVSTMRCVELLTWRHLEPGLALELEDTQKAVVKSRRKRSMFFSALDCVGGAPLAPGSVPIRNGTKLGIINPLHTTKHLLLFFCHVDCFEASVSTTAANQRFTHPQLDQTYHPERGNRAKLVSAAPFSNQTNQQRQ